MILGAHVSTQGGVGAAPENASRIGAEAIQIFTRNQRAWRSRPLPEEEVKRFRTGVRSHGVRGAIAHDSYLINLASPDRAVLDRSRRAFTDEIRRADALGLGALVLHPGSHLGKGIDRAISRITKSLLHCLDRASPRSSVRILLENAAGQGTNVGHDLGDLARILERLEPRSRFGVCLDTCHLFAAGYDLRTTRGYEAVMREVGRTVGLRRVRAWHLNDSKKGLGCRVDRHENLGRGHIGRECFRRIVNDPRWEGIPLVLETPGGEAWFRRNLALLRSFLPEARRGRARPRSPRRWTG